MEVIVKLTSYQGWIDFVTTKTCGGGSEYFTVVWLADAKWLVDQLVISGLNERTLVSIGITR